MNSPALSKINWTQVVGFAATVFALFGIDLSPEMQATVVMAITAVWALATMIWRTWFTAPAA